jgi:hypothetical protein
MNIRSSLKVMLLALVVSPFAAKSCDTLCDKLFDTNNWYLTPKIGVAPSVFAGRARQQLVVPRAALNLVSCSSSTTPNDCVESTGLLDNFANTLQETACLPKFNDMFKQGVLHVGVELGYQSCDSSCPVFVEFVYNRANGRCVTPCNAYTVVASTGCANNDCNTSCTTKSSCADSCTPSAQALDAQNNAISNICNFRDSYSNYSAYGAYIGGRHFTNRFWCDSTSFWFGYKVGILHRKQVNSCSILTVPNNCAEAVLCNSTQDLNINRAIFCKSNAVSGGIQFGFDYNYSDCLAFQLGLEVVASSGLTGNRNHTIDIAAITDDTGRTNVIYDCANLPSNILVRNSGTLVNFPIWFGVRWDFGSFCSSSC